MQRTLRGRAYHGNPGKASLCEIGRTFHQEPHRVGAGKQQPVECLYARKRGIQCRKRSRLDELHADLLRDLEKQPARRPLSKLFVKLRFADFSHTSVERCGVEPLLDVYRALLAEGWRRRAPAERVVRLLGVGVRFTSAAGLEASADKDAPVAAADAAEQFVLSL